MEQIKALIEYLVETKEKRDELAQESIRTLYSCASFPSLKEIIDRIEELVDEAEVLGVSESSNGYRVHVGYERFLELLGVEEYQPHEVKQYDGCAEVMHYRAEIDDVQLVTSRTYFGEQKNASA